MKPIILLTVFSSLLGSAFALAQADSDDSSKLWLKEPKEFLGIDLDGDFSAQVPPCPEASIRPTTMCRIATSSPDRFDILGLPYLPISQGYKLVAIAPQGRIKELLLKGPANNLHLVADMLIDDFGEPGARTSRRLRASSGASYQSELLNWQGENVAISFQRDESDLSRYSVTVSVDSGASTVPETVSSMGEAEQKTKDREISTL